MASSRCSPWLRRQIRPALRSLTFPAVDINGRDEYVSLFYHTLPISLHTTGGVISDSSLHIIVTVVLYTNRGTLRFPWPRIGETSPRSSFYLSKAPIRHSR